MKNRYQVKVYKGAVPIFERIIEATDTVGVILNLSLREELQGGFNRIDINRIKEDHIND